jgi:4-hydroxybenzoate polyprenyltransferase
MKTILRPHAPTSLSFWQDYLVQMRPYLFFVSGVSGLTGMAIAYAATYAPASNLIAAFFPFLFAYGFGQALTDCFQKDTDRLSAPYRPLSQGLLLTKDVAVVSIAGLVSCGLILVSLRFSNIYLAALSVFGLATYSFVKKNYWWGGPFYNAWIVMLLPVMGCLSLGGSLRMLPIPVLLLTFFSYSSFVLIGYLKDISADRETGYKTYPVVFGWNSTVWVGNLFFLASAVCCYVIVKDAMAGIALWLAGSLVAAWGQLVALRVQPKVEKNSTIPVLATVRSFIIWQLAVILTYQPDWWAQAIFFYALFELVLSLRPEKHQI